MTSYSSGEPGTEENGKKGFSSFFFYEIHIASAHETQFSTTSS